MIEVSPLVEVSESDLNLIAIGMRPDFAFIPSIADKRLVADLSRTMTVEKSVVSAWKRTQGLRNDEEIRKFQQALIRKHTRFACFWQLKRGPPLAIKKGATPGKNI